MNLTLTLSTGNDQEIANVSVMGSWDEWATKMQMDKVASGQWTATCVVPEGKVRFKFLVDGQWRTGEAYDVEDDGFGGVNNFVLVKELGLADSQDDGADALHVELHDAPVEDSEPVIEQVTDGNAEDLAVVGKEEEDMAVDLDTETAEQVEDGDAKANVEGEPEKKEEGCVVC